MGKQITELLQRHPELSGCAADLEAFSKEVISLFRQNGTLFCCGNGGSAADCDHICGEFLKGFCQLRPLSESERNRFVEVAGEEGRGLAGKLQHGLRAISLLSHPGYTSAFANDVDPTLVFAQQLFALARPGDILLGISTGGGAANVKAAFQTARAIGVRTVLLTGNRHGVCEEYADRVIAVPESETFRVQELHLPVYHALCLEVEAAMFPESAR